MTSLLPFCYDNEGFFTNQKCFIITGESLKYLVSFLNSKLFKFAFKNKFPELMGNTYELSKIFFDKLQIPKLSAKQQQPFIELVDKILASKACIPDGNAGVQALLAIDELEREIDKLVYALYELSKEEILIVEA